MTRIIVAGGRDFNDYDYLCESMDELVATINDKIEIISGTAKGADSLGARYGKEHGIPVVEFKPDWKLYGRAAGVLRNQQMLDYAKQEYPILAAFWDGQSKGTKDMIGRARKAGAQVMIFRYDQK